MGVGFHPQPKPSSRLDDTKDESGIRLVTAKAFKIEVWTRDHWMCRCCHRHVTKTISRIPERGEVHHIYGRIGDLRFEARAALLLCLSCHEKVTGRVAEKWIIEAVPLSVFFTLLRIPTELIDARGPLTFTRVA